MNDRLPPLTDAAIRAALTLEPDSALVRSVTADVVQRAAATRQVRAWPVPWPSWSPAGSLAARGRPFVGGLRYGLAAGLLLLALVGALLVAGSRLQPARGPFVDGVLAVGGSGGGLTLVDGSGRLIGTVGTQVVASAAWSPDGTRLAFWNGLGSDWTLDMLELDGATVKRIVGSEALEGVVPAQRHILDPEATMHFLPSLPPAWSPDGRRLLVSILRSGSPALLVVDVRDGSVTSLTLAGTEGSVGAWSPDGTRIAWYAAPAYTDDYELFVADAADLVPRRVDGLADVTYRGTMAWSPDGRRLMLGGSIGADEVLLEIDPSDGRRVRSYDTPDLDRAFGWSPTGDRIAWSTLGERGADGLWVMSADGAGRRQLASDACWGGRGWSPSGEELLYTSGCTPRSPEEHVRAVSVESGEVRDLWTYRTEVVRNLWGVAWQGIPRERMEDASPPGD